MTASFILVVLALVAVAPAARAEADGAAIFAKQCATCHGKTGAADTKPAEMLKIEPLAGNQDVIGASVDDLVTTIKANDKHKAMLKKVSDDELSAAAAHAKSLAGE